MSKVIKHKTVINLETGETSLVEIKSNPYFGKNHIATHSYPHIDKEILVKLYVDKKKSTCEITKILGVSWSNVYYSLKRYGIKMRDRNEIKKIKMNIRRPAKEELIDLYLNKKLSANKIAKIKNIDSHVVINWLKFHGIYNRSRSEAAKVRGISKEFSKIGWLASLNYWKEYSKGNKPKLHRTEEMRKNLSRKLKGRFVAKWSEERKIMHSLLLKNKYASGEIKPWIKNAPDDDPRMINFRKVCGSEENREKLRENRAKQVFPLKDSQPELVLQNMLKTFGVKFRKHKTLKNLLPEHYDKIKGIVPGKGRQHQFDIVIDSAKLIIEADGCFWHSCNRCGFETKYYSQRVNKVNDEIVNKVFVNGDFYGWRLVRIWAHDLNTIGDAIAAIEREIPGLLVWPKDDFITIPDKLEREEPEISSTEEEPIEEDLDFGVLA